MNQSQEKYSDILYGGRRNDKAYKDVTKGRVKIRSLGPLKGTESGGTISLARVSSTRRGSSPETYNCCQREVFAINKEGLSSALTEH